MSFLKKNWGVFLILLCISIIYFVLRIPNLTLQPIFADEAIYIRWSQIMKSEPTLRFISLQDGKTPLFMWILMPVLVFFKDPLFAGRILSVFSGFVTLLGVFILGWTFFNKRVAVLSAFLVATTPIFVFFDRMALVDSMFSAFTIWGLFLTLLLVRFIRFDLAMVLGAVIGGSILVKTPGYFNLALVPVTILTFPWKNTKRSKLLIRLILCWIITAIIALGIYNLLRLGPGFGNLSTRNADYIYPLTHLFTEPLNPLVPHLKDIFLDWYPKMISIPVLVFILGGIVLSFWKRNLVAITIFLFSLGPFFIESALIKAFTLRYILFTVPTLILLAGYFMDYLIDVSSKYRKDINLNYYVGFLLIAIPCIYSLSFDMKLLTNPAKADLPIAERHGYLEDWTAGYGFSEIAKYLESQSAKGEIVVGTEGFFGTLPDGLWIYLDKTPNVTILGSAPEMSNEIRNSAEIHPTYYVANRSRVRTNPSNTELLKEYKKPTDKDGFTDAILLYRVLP